jgi:hypothetical protein
MWQDARSGDGGIMPTAEEVASMLTYEFLKRGNYAASAGPVQMPELAEVAPASARQESEEFLTATEAFGGLAVQSVGCEEGVDDPKVYIYLTRGSVRLIKSLPPEIDRVPIVAQKMGPVAVKPETAGTTTNRAYFFERNGRVCCGSSCAPTSENCSGTLGALVQKEGTQQIYLLSNNHVFGGCNHVPQNQPILSPSSNDSRPDTRAPTEIGRHAEIHELRSGDPSFVNACEADLALARATNPMGLSSWQGDAGNGYDTPTRSLSPVSRMPVKKVGRTTGLTHGIIQSRIPAPAPLPYTARHFKGVVWFSNVWIVRSVDGTEFAIAGDSGSLVVAEDNSFAVGVLFAASRSGEYGWIMPMPCVLGAFGGLRLVGKHGV